VELAVARMAAPDLAGARVDVQVDALLRDELAAHPERFLGTGEVGGPRLGEWVPVLVVEASGRVVPMSHGFPARHELGNLRDAPLLELASTWHRSRAAGFAAACARAHAELSSDRGPVVSYWYEAMAALVALDEPVAVAVTR
jgi:hypothetical protein